jgi:outer membrane protein OmpA-like peptidoglycan-associated protein
MNRVPLASLLLLGGVFSSNHLLAQEPPPPPPLPPPAPAAPPTGAAPAAPAPAPTTDPSPAPAPAPTAPAAAEPAPAPSTAPAAEASAGATAGGTIDLAAGVTTPSEGAAATEDSERERERKRRAASLHEQNNINGSVGLLRLTTPTSGAPGTFRFSLLSSYFGSTGFLCNSDTECPSLEGEPRDLEDDVDRVGLHLGLSATVLPFLELSAALHNTATSNTRSRPNLLQVLGDTTFGVKGFMPDERGQIVQFGGQLELMLLNGTGGVGLDGGGTSFSLRAMTSFALDNFANPDDNVPLRFHTNLGYVFDNSGNLVDDIENTPPPNGRGEPILRTERFGLDINRVDSFQIGLGGEYINEYVRPFIEWSIDVPVNRQDYTCDENIAADHGDLCLAKSQTFSAAPSRLTLGARVYPWSEQGLAILGAVDIGTGATSVFLDEVAPEPPYNLWLGLAWAVDTVPPPPVIERVQVAAPPAPVVDKARYVIGYVIDKESGSPVPSASVLLEGRPVPGFITADDGTFKTYPLDTGNYTFAIKAAAFKDGQCTVSIAPPVKPGMPEPAPAAGAQPGTAPLPDGAIAVRCELEALPKRGNVLGSLVDAETQAPVGNARVKIRDRQGRELDVVADSAGAFRIEKVLPGTVTIIIDAPGYFASTSEFPVKALEDTPARILLNKRPDKPNVVVQGKELKLKKQVHFQIDSAEILPDSMGILEEIADVLKTKPELKMVEVQGHTDNQGTTAYNLRLSQNRAQAVVDSLIKLGVDPSRLEAKGYGDTKPLLPNTTEPNKARNRRVQLLIK